MKRKLCSVLLALCMVLTLLPVSALAEGGTASDGDALKKLFSDVKAGEASSGNVTVTLDKDYNLTDYSWTSLAVDGYHGAGIVTVEGNNHTITGLNAPLFAGGFAGTSGTVIKNLTLTGVQINDSTSDQGIGAFINNVDSMPKIELDNCHLIDSTITSTGGARVGGLIGWTSGYNKENDGPVDTYITVKNCSVENTEITANGSVGGIIGHAGCNPATFHTFNSNAVTNCTLNSTDNGGWRVGVVVGTANVGEISIANTTESNNTLTQTGKTFPDGQSNLYGRFVPNTTGKLVIDGVPVFNSDIIAAIGSTGYKTLADAVTAADNTTVTLLKDTTENVTIPAGKTITLDLNGHKIVNSATAQDKNVAEDSRKHTITNNGTLTILDSVGGGVVDNVSHGRAALYNAGTIVEIKGGKFTRSVDNSTDATSANGNSWYVIYNAEGANITKISSGEFLALGHFSSLFCNSGTINEISGGTFTQDGFIAFKNEGTVNKISGGTFSSESESCIQNWGTIGEISDGTITAGRIGIWNFSSDTYKSAGTISRITGGNISGTTAAIRLNDYDTDYKDSDKNVKGPSTVNKANASISAGNFSGALEVNAHTVLTITGGTYSVDPSAYVVPGYVASYNGSTYTVYYPVPVTPGNNNNSSSTTTKNPDGSTTTTTTDKTTGTVTETTKNPDGSTTTVETKKDGSVTETNKTAGGSVGTVKSDANGNSEISANISAADVSAAAKKNEPVAAPVSVAPAASPAAAPVIKLSVPASAGEVSVVIPVTNAQQGTVAIKVNPDGTEEIIKTSVVTKDGVVLGVKGSTQIKIVNNDKDFSDTVGHWAESDVDFVSARELFTGTAPQTFSPESATTRGMVVTVLARLAGESTDGGANWYDKGCAWAVTNGVSDGTDPNGTVSREQLAAMLYRYFGSPAVSGSLSFADASSVSEYAHDAMQWCVNNGIINGMDGLLNPQGQATRAQVSAMFARYIHLAATK